MNILVTGATGFIGVELVNKLAMSGHKVRCLVRKNSDLSKLRNLENISFFYGDITDIETIKNVAENIDVVFHLAVLGHFLNGGYEDYVKINVFGLENILKECQKSAVKKIIYTTTSATIGVIKKKKIDEQDKGKPTNEYGKSKLLAEKIIEKYERRGLPIVMILFTHVYGPGETRDLFKIIRFMKLGLFPQIGLSKNLYPAVYIDDAVQGLVLAMSRGEPGEKYIITDNHSHDLKDVRKIVYRYFNKRFNFYLILPKYPIIILLIIAERLLKVLGIKVPFGSRNIKSISSGREFSILKAKNKLGFKPKVSLDEGINKSLDYYVKNNLL